VFFFQNVSKGFFSLKKSQPRKNQRPATDLEATWMQTPLGAGLPPAPSFCRGAPASRAGSLPPGGEAGRRGRRAEAPQRSPLGCHSGRTPPAPACCSADTCGLPSAQAPRPPGGLLGG
ncbi:unnamed protein product, partial [Gulo gulo]